MVASSSSCTCAACGTTCPGRFTGCASVWARGPVPVAVTRRPLRSRRETVASGGEPSAGEAAIDAPGGDAAAELAGATQGDGPPAALLRGILDGLEANASAVRALHAKLDELGARLDGLAQRDRSSGHAPEPALDGAAGEHERDEVLAALDELPRRIATALATVLRESRDPAVAELLERIDVLLEHTGSSSPVPPMTLGRGGHSAAR